jgi:YD repeat-containing protein
VPKALDYFEFSIRLLFGTATSLLTRVNNETRRVLLAVLIFMPLLLVLGGSTVSMAGQERYEYDPIGRLVRYVDSSNQVTEYSYDAAGNILSVAKGGSANSYIPTLTGVTPNFIRRGETKAITLTGQRLQTGILQTSDAAMDLANVRQTATQIQADLLVGLSASTGPQTLTFSNAEGAAKISIAVGPTLPELSVEPSPLALPPDNATRAITVRLSGADVIAHQIVIASTDVAKVTVSPANLTLSAGQTAAQVNITSKAAGFVNLVLTSPTLRTLTVPVFITTDFRGVNTSYASPVGVVVGDAQPPAATATTSGTFISPRVGVAVGAVLTQMQPKALAVNASTNLIINGINIPGVVQVAATPATGVTLGSPTVSGNGTQISVPLLIDANAAPGPRRILVTDALGASISFADQSQSQLVLTTGQPTIASVEPLFATAGTTMRLKVRGANLQNGQLLINPAIDLRVDSQPAVNSDGTELLVNVQIAALAATGARTVQVITPSGQSTATANAANQLTLVREIKPDVGPIFAYPVGVMVGTVTVAQNTQTITPVTSPNVGVTVGAFALTTTPKVGVVGTTVTFVVSGQGLQAVQSVSVSAPTGLTVGAMSVNNDGSQLTVPIGIDVNAPKALRRLILNTAGSALIFLDPSQANFLVAAPAPELISITPQVVQAGQASILSILGINLRDIVGVRFEPTQGLTALQPVTANTGGTQVSVTIQAASNALSGPRTLVVVTAGGESSAVQVPGNTFYVAQQTGPVIGAITAQPVGVLVGTATAPPATSTLGIYAPAVGVLVQSVPVEITTDRLVSASNVGVIVGTAVTGMTPSEPDGFLKGGSGTLIFNGFGLDQVTSSRLIGASATSITLGAAVANPSGTQLTVPVTVNANADSGPYSVGLSTGSGTQTFSITSTNFNTTKFKLGSLPSLLQSVSPIVLEQGKSYTFTVRGTGLQDVYQLVTDPAGGFNAGFDGIPVQWSTDTFGEKLTARFSISPNAAIGSRVIRLRVPGGITDAVPLPANTVTIVAPQ